MSMLKAEFFQNTAEFGIKNGQSEFDDVWHMLLNYRIRIFMFINTRYVKIVLILS